MAQLTPWLIQKFYATNGKTPLSGGQVFTYEAGTSTKKDTFTTQVGDVAQSNPIILNANGEIEPAMWLDSGAYKIVVAPADDTDPPVAPLHEIDNVFTSGGDSVGVANTVTDLKALTDADFDAVTLLGYDTIGDGGGGTFRWADGDSTAENGGTIFEPDDGGGRWIRMYDGYINPKWFGAKGDSVANGSSGTDDQAAIVACLTWADENEGDVYFPDGYYLIGSNFSVGNSTKVIMSPSASFTASSDTYITFYGQIECGLTQAFAGDIIVSLASDSCEYALPEWWGAAGDGVIDDTEAVQGALDTKVQVQFQSNQSYRVSAQIAVYGNVDISTSGTDQAEIYISADTKAFNFQVDSAASTTVADEVQMIDEGITVADATGFEAGQLVVMESDALWYWDNRGTLHKGEVHVIKSVVGNVLNFTEPCCDNYADSETVTVDAYPYTTCNVRNIKFRPSSQLSNTVFSFAHYQNSVVENLTFVDTDYTGLSVVECFDTRVTNMHANLNADIDVSLGYGCQTNGAAYCKITESHFMNCRRGVDFSGGIPSRFCTVENCSASHEEESDNASGFGTHGTAENCTFIGNIVHGGRLGIFSRGGNISIIDNTFTGQGQQAILVGHGNNVHIEGNVVSSPSQRTELTTTLGNMSYSRFVEITSSYDAGGLLTIKNNNVFAIQSSFVRCSQVDIRANISGNRCIFRNTSAGADVYYLEGAVDWGDSFIGHNEFIVDVGDFKGVFDVGSSNTPTDDSVIIYDGAGYSDSNITLTDTGIVIPDDGSISTSILTMYFESDGLRLFRLNNPSSLVLESDDGSVAPNDLVGGYIWKAGEVDTAVVGRIDLKAGPGWSGTNSISYISFEVTKVDNLTSTDVMRLNSTDLSLNDGMKLLFFDTSFSGNYIGFEAPTLSGTQVWVLPDSDGDANEILQTDGSGNLSFDVFKPRRVDQAGQPTPAVGELMWWRNNGDGKTYLVYNDTVAGVRKCEFV